MNAAVDNLSDLTTDGARTIGRRRWLFKSRMVRIGPYEMDAVALGVLGSLLLHALVMVSIATWMIIRPPVRINPTQQAEQPHAVVQVKMLDAAAMAKLFPKQDQPEQRPNVTPPPMPANHRIDPAPVMRPQFTSPNPVDTPTPDQSQSIVQTTQTTQQVNEQLDEPPTVQVDIALTRNVDVQIEPAPVPPQPTADQNRVAMNSKRAIGKDDIIRPDPISIRRLTKLGYEGSVRVEVSLNRDGHVDQVRVIDSQGHRQLVQLAVEAAKKIYVKPKALDQVDTTKSLVFTYRFEQ